MSTTTTVPRERIRVGTSGLDATVVMVGAEHGPDWFPLHIGDGRMQSTLYLRRTELRALRDRLNAIDLSMPTPEPRA